MLSEIIQVVKDKHHVTRKQRREEDNGKEGEGPSGNMYKGPMEKAKGG